MQFHFDYETCYPVAMATLAEDEKLQKMRFDLVPKKSVVINEGDGFHDVIVIPQHCGMMLS